ncbi:MAG: DUF4358 domain-containing protein [Lachnospiraceae bacterium]|jgi:predicted small lipoprotein YifL|nr:DUF4358 domain-containing protein [Lachnospiraceae bacterium]
MKKYLCIALAAVMMVFSLTACGGKGSAKEVTASADELAKKLAEETVTSDKLSAVSSDILASTYFVDMDQVEDSAAYLSTGASSCEAVVIKCKESSYTSEVEQLLKKRVESQSTLYASYAPDEAAKLDSAIIKVSGSYVVLSVADDTEKASSILSDAGF